MPYSVVDFAKSLRIDRCKIQQTPSLIFLCGGKTAEDGPYKSARDYFNRHLKRKKPAIAARVKLAEEVNEQFQRGNAFTDLLELENYLAHLADITVLFVESPGSIAELGAFANSDVIRPKTLVVLNSSHEPDGSFISNGPIRKLSNENENHVHYYTWDPDDLNSELTKAEFAELTRELVTFLEEKIEAARPRQPSLKTAERGHALLLLADLIRMPGVATTSELLECLSALRFKVDRAILKRYLSILQSVGFVIAHPRSNQTFFVRTSERSFIRYAYLEGTRFRDQYRIMNELRQGLTSIKRRAITHALRKSTGGRERRG